VLMAAVLAVACSSSTAPNAYVPWLPLPRGNAELLAPPPSPPVPIPTGTPSPVPLLMQIDTPALASTPDFQGGRALSAGQAFMNIQWSGCPMAHALLLYLGLEAGAGRLTIPFPVDSPCSSQLAASGVSRGPLNPTGVPWPPAPDQVTVRYAIDAPASAKRGATLEFFVTIGNAGSADYPLQPCPDYSEALVPAGPVTYRQLNCTAVGAIKPGRSVRFQMKFAIPSATPTGAWTLQFGMVDGRITPPGIQVPITITD
jgi:hypothetical protein